MLPQILMTALLSGVFAGLVNFVLGDRRGRAELRLTKSEQALEAVLAYSYELIDFVISLQRLCDDSQQTTNPAKVEELFIQHKHMFDLAGKAGGLISIYQPQLIDLWTPLDKIRVGLGEFRDRKEPDQVAAASRHFSDSLVRARDARQLLTNSLAKECRRIIERRPLSDGRPRFPKSE